jgi:hypothetical protein
MNTHSVFPEEREATPELASDLHLHPVETMGLEPTTPCLQSAPAQTHNQVIHASTQVRAFRQERPER